MSRGKMIILDGALPFCNNCSKELLRCEALIPDPKLIEEGPVKCAWCKNSLALVKYPIRRPE